MPGIFSANFLDGNSGNDIDAKLLHDVVEAFIMDDIAHSSQEEIDEFCKPNGLGEALCEAGVLGSGPYAKRSITKLSKTDELNRRENMAALILAKQAKDPLWAALAKNRVKEKELLGKIKTKYASKAMRVAKVGQKEYMKAYKTKKVVPKSFKDAGGDDR